MTRVPVDSRRDRSTLMRLLYRYAQPHSKLLAAALVLSAASQIFSLLDPLIVRLVIDRYATRHGQYSQTQFLRGAGLLLLAAAGVALLARAARSLQDYFVTAALQRTGAALYADGIRHVLELPFREFEDRRSGETLSQLQKVRSDVERLIPAIINVVFVSSIGVLFVTLYAVRVHWSIAPAFLLAAPLLALSSGVLSRRIRHMQRRIFAESNALAGATTESLRNIELVKSLGLVDREVKRLNRVTEKLRQLELGKLKYTRRLTFLQGAVVNGLRGGILCLLLYLVFSQHITLGQMFALAVYSFSIFTPLQGLGNVLALYRESEVSLGNFQSLLTYPRPHSPMPVERVGNLMTLQCEGVSFRYGHGPVLALDGVDFSAARGDTIALVGPSGAGKSTLVKLLVGLYAPQAGEIRYNGITSARADLDRVREGVGIVTQDTQLFAGSLRENLLFANPQGTDADCREALQQAGFGSLLSRANTSLDARVGEAGLKLSGGEKQRLAIARALLRHPQLLLFDEATSSLDSLSEEEIGQTVRALARNGSAITILIAHRLSTVRHADRIYVLERGRIVDSGRHAELLSRQGLYAAMWRLQAGRLESATAAKAAGV